MRTSQAPGREETAWTLSRWWIRRSPCCASGAASPIAPSSGNFSWTMTLWTTSRTNSSRANAWRWMRRASAGLDRATLRRLAPLPSPASLPVPPQPPPPCPRRNGASSPCCSVTSWTPPPRQQLDPEELREVVRDYQDTCARVIARFAQFIAVCRRVKACHTGENLLIRAERLS